jgi:uncharacterized protein (TIGR02118 family)
VARSTVEREGLGVNTPAVGPDPQDAAVPGATGPVKLFEFLGAPAGPAEPGLAERWAEERSVWLGGHADLAHHLKRHELYRRHPATVESPRAGEEAPDPGFQAVSIQWFESLNAYQAMRSAPEAAELRELDRRFWPGPTASVLTGEPDLIVGPAGGVPGSGASLICILRRTPGMDLAQFHDHWLHHHGGLFQTIPELTEPLRGYEQNHGLDLADAQYDGVTQQWFDSLEAFVASVAVPSFVELVAPDTAYFLDATHLHFIMADGSPLVVVG